MVLSLHCPRRNEVAGRNTNSNHRDPDCGHRPAPNDRSRFTYIGKYRVICSHSSRFGLSTEPGSVFLVSIDPIVDHALPVVAEHRVDTPDPS